MGAFLLFSDGSFRGEKNTFLGAGNPVSWFPGLCTWWPLHVSSHLDHFFSWPIKILKQIGGNWERLWGSEEGFCWLIFTWGLCEKRICHSPAFVVYLKNIITKRKEEEEDLKKVMNWMIVSLLLWWRLTEAAHLPTKYRFCLNNEGQNWTHSAKMKRRERRSSQQHKQSELCTQSTGQQ